MLLAAAGVATIPALTLGGESLIFPGVAVNDIDFTVGAWCRYIVVDEIMGDADTTIVYLAVTGKARTDGADAYWVEFDSKPKGAQPADRQTVKALISSDIKDSSPGDSLRHHVSALFVKKGGGAVEPGDPEGLDRLTASHPSADSEWVLTHDEFVETPAGRYSCDRKRLVVEDKRSIKMGGTTLHKNNRDVYTVWFNNDVPVFRVVKYVVERIRDSKTIPAIPGMPDKGKEETRTTVVLYASGSDAKPIVEVPQ